MSDHSKERSMMEHPSRRNFLGMGSAALATVALTTMTANAQTQASTRKAEQNHSSSDPGQENKGLLALNPNSNTPPPTDHGDVVPLWYSFDLVKKRVEEGGWTHEVTERVLPSSRDIAGVNMRLTARSYREMHWHTADEWAYVLYGKARVTVMQPDGICLSAMWRKEISGSFRRPSALHSGPRSGWNRILACLQSGASPKMARCSSRSGLPTLLPKSLRRTQA